MWVRLKLDIRWLDLLAALRYCLTPGDRGRTASRTARSWSGGEDFLITLSVRSAFDLALRALRLPPGSEILFSAWTVPDMMRITQAHGLVPVPLDVDEQGHVALESVRQAITAQTRMIVVAHLFGGFAPLDDIITLARQHSLLVVEDCAQSFHRVGDGGHPSSDLAMFSFGPIKTASALGGAVVRVASPGLRQSMSNQLSQDPIQTRAAFARRVARFAAIKLLSANRVCSLFRRVVTRLGYDFDSLANAMGRGFSASNLLEQLRRQPSTPLLRLLERRWRTYESSRIVRRIELGRMMDQRLQVRRPQNHIYWVYPIFTDSPSAVRDRLQAAGFDATCQTRMCVIPPVDATRLADSADRNLQRVVFLPWYPELPMERAEALAQLLTE
jgi:dTDP-4-amino-4,6-dideoxygalactose transaminase